MRGTRVLDQGRPPAKLSVPRDPVSLASPRSRNKTHVYNERAREAGSSRYDAAAVENGDIILDDAVEFERRFPLTRPPLADAFRKRSSRNWRSPAGCR